MFNDFRAFTEQAGYRLIYHPGEVNHCPSCDRTHWIVGRHAAECAFCNAALPLQDAGMVGAGIVRRTGTPAFA